MRLLSSTTRTSYGGHWCEGKPVETSCGEGRHQDCSQNAVPAWRERGLQLGGMVPPRVPGRTEESSSDALTSHLCGEMPSVLPR